MIAQDPLYKSGRAALLHPAPAWDDNAEADERVGMTDAGGRKPPGDVPRHPAPQEAGGLSAAQEHAMRQPAHFRMEEVDDQAVPRHTEVPDVAFRLSLTASAPRSDHPCRGGRRISRLDTRPARSPVNASPPSLSTAAHDSGSEWVASPSLCETFIHCTMPL